MKRLILFLSLAIAGGVQAQVPVKVTINFAKKAIAVSGDAATADVLRSDLKLSGAFEIKPAGEAEYLAQVSGGNCAVSQTATKTSVMTKAYQASGRALAHAMADDIVQTITGQRGIAQTKIAFIYAKTPRAKELAVMDYDGFNVRVLTRDGKSSGHPRWSPDGQKIAYTSYWKGYPDVLEADLSTNQRRILANFPGVNSGAAYSPDGNTIALTLSKDGNPELYTMSTSGGRFVRLTNTDGIESSPAWSPDGQSIAYVSNSSGTPQIWLIGRNGGEPRRLTVSPSRNTEPAWSNPPAGAEAQPMIAVTSEVGKFQIGIYDGDRAVTPVVADGTDNSDPSWAPDGRHIVFAKARNYRSRLYLLDVRTKEQIELPAIEGEASEPAWDLGAEVNEAKFTRRTTNMRTTILAQALILTIAVGGLTGCKNGRWFWQKPLATTGGQPGALGGGTPIDVKPGERPDLLGEGGHGDFTAVLFDYDSSKIRPSEFAKLETVASSLKSSGKKLIVEGHTDERGTAEYNRSLGEKRALSARQALVSLGIAATRISTVSYGKDRPVEASHDDTAWSRNRRCEFVLVNQ